MPGTTLSSTGTLSVVVDAVVWAATVLGLSDGVVESGIVEKTLLVRLVEEAVSVEEMMLLLFVLVGTAGGGPQEEPSANDDDSTMVSVTVEVGASAVAVVAEARMQEHALLNRSLESQTAA
ncbi:hypothetical protein PG994_008653 [Apiospora phragmitis]|uniref:Secreted protein n=1 Tax=Apiospora phragmitis TaxID=2905665 RepID=A0ABR1UJI1_9PEZI